MSDMSSPQVCFRIAQADDLPQIIAMLSDDEIAREREAAASAAIATAQLSAFETINNDPNHELIVGAIDAEVIAVLQLSYLPGLTYNGGWRAQIEGVRVARSQQAQGIGKLLIQHAMDLARHRQCVLVQLTTDRRRDQALAFYARIGFAPSHVGMKLRLRDHRSGTQS